LLIKKNIKKANIFLYSNAKTRIILISKNFIKLPKLYNA
jgi:hypothetical protein